MRVIFVAFALLFVGLTGHVATAQTAGRATVSGTVSGVTVSASQFVMKTDKGDSITVTTNDKTSILHLAAGVTDASKATKIAFGDLQAGDRVVAYYRGAEGDKAVTATTVVVRTTSDLSDIAKAELADWKKRGTVGNVTSVDPAAKTITVKVGAKMVTVSTSDKTQFHRYSLDSAKPADAKPSSFAEVKVGDQIHVLGNKNEDGTSTTSEQVYAGEFRQLAATIVSVNPANGELQVKDLASKKPMTIKVDSDSTLKKLDPQMAAMLARRYGVGRGGQDGAPGGGGGGRGGDGAGGRGQGGGGDGRRTRWFRRTWRTGWTRRRRSRRWRHRHHARQVTGHSAHRSEAGGCSDGFYHHG